MRKWLRIHKLKFIQRSGFKLTSDERSELAFWITRKVKEPVSETLREMRK